MGSINENYQYLVNAHKISHNGKKPSLIKRFLYAVKAFGYSIRKKNVKKNIVSESDYKLNNRSLLQRTIMKDQNENAKSINNKRSVPLENYKFIWSKMKPEECSGHLEIIENIEAIVIESLNNGEITEQHILSLQENLSQWEKLSPDTEIPQRDDLKSILNEPKDSELEFNIRMLFPMHESGSFAVINGRKKAVSTYKGLLSEQVASVHKTLIK